MYAVTHTSSGFMVVPTAMPRSCMTRTMYCTTISGATNLTTYCAVSPAALHRTMPIPDATMYSRTPSRTWSMFANVAAIKSAGRMPSSILNDTSNVPVSSSNSFVSTKFRTRTHDTLLCAAWVTVVANTGTMLSMCSELPADISQIGYLFTHIGGVPAPTGLMSVEYIIFGSSVVFSICSTNRASSGMFCGIGSSLMLSTIVCQNGQNTHVSLILEWSVPCALCAAYSRTVGAAISCCRIKLHVVELVLRNVIAIWCVLSKSGDGVAGINFAIAGNVR